jgi:hypothetical protein
LLGGLQNTFNGNVLCSVRAPLFQATQGSMEMCCVQCEHHCFKRNKVQ